MYKFAGFAAFAVLALGAPSAAQAGDDVAQKIKHGQVNYTKKNITVTGSGAPNLKAANVAVARLGAERAAKMDAFRNILEAVKGVRVSGNTSAADAMSSPSVKSSVEGVIRNFKVLDTKYYSDGGVDLIVEVPLDGVTMAVVQDAGSKAKVAGGKTDTTGIIINAKGLSVTPALAPRILDEGGAEVYGASHVSKDAVQQSGVAGYTKSLSAAMKDNRVAGKPLVVKAVKTAQKGSADLVISAADAKKLGDLGAVLAKGKVIIVTD